jgi:hypothetical protein
MQSVLSIDAIEKEQLEFERYSKLPKYKNQSLYAINSLSSPRDFERLVFYLYRTLSISPGATFNDIWLMQGTSDRGRDIQLNLDNQCIGIIQCKRYASPLTRPQILQELLKFALYNLENQAVRQHYPFHYYLASVEGLRDTAKEVVGAINSGNLDSIESVIEVEFDKLTHNSHYSFQSLTFHEVKKQLFETLTKLKVIPIDKEFISELLDKDLNTRSRFFELDKVIDLAAFDELLTAREQSSLRSFRELSSLEKELQIKDKGLYDTLTSIKLKTLELIDQYPLNFLDSANHRGEHTRILPTVASSILGETSNLNSSELFVLLVSLYLTDIGVCQQIDSRDRVEIVRSHPELSADFITESGSSILDIPQKYIRPIQMLVRSTSGFLQHPDNRADYISNYSVESFAPNRINLGYLAALVWVSDAMDISNLNSEFLLRNYRAYPGYGAAKVEWDEQDFQLTVGFDQEIVLFQAPKQVNNQLLYLSITREIDNLRAILEVANSMLSKENRSLPIKFASNRLTSNLKRKIGITVDWSNILTKLLGKKLYEKEIYAVRELVQNALDACSSLAS